MKILPCYLNKRLVLILLLIPFLQLSAQSPRTPGWLNKYARNTYHEGPYSDQVNSEPLKLIGYYSSFSSYQFNQGQRLTTHFYSPQSARIYLKAEERNASCYYWMEKKGRGTNAGWNTFPNWEVDNWLKRCRLYKDNIAILASVEMNGRYGDFYAPVSVGTSGRRMPISSYTVLFRNNFYLSEGIIQLYKGFSADPANLLSNKPMSINRKSNGGSFGVLLTKGTIGNYAGWITLQMRYRKKNDPRTYTRNFHLYHPGWN